jgi:ankyrin repeat protein
LLSRLLSTAPSTSTLTRALASAAQTGQCASLGLIVPALAADAAPALTHALSLALHDGHRDAVSLLLAAKADVGGVDLFDRPMLLGAVKGGFADIVRDLLASGVDPNQTANLSHTPLVSASDPATVRVLLDAKADVGVPHVLRGAVDALQPEAVRMLLEAKADANCSTRISAETPLSRVLGPSIDCRDQDRVKRKLQVMELLLDAGAEYRNIGGSCSAAHICAGTLHDPSGVTAAEALVRRDPTVLQCVNGAGHTPMETAVLSLNAELVEVFIKHGADVNATCSANTPMLFTVCRAFRSEGSSARRVLRLLLAAGADPRACGGRNTTVLMELVRMKPAVPELTVRACLYDVIESVLRGPAQAQQGCESRVP